MLETVAYFLQLHEHSNIDISFKIIEADSEGPSTLEINIKTPRITNFPNTSLEYPFMVTKKDYTISTYIPMFDLTEENLYHTLDRMYRYLHDNKN